MPIGGERHLCVLNRQWPWKTAQSPIPHSSRLIINWMYSIWRGLIQHLWPDIWPFCEAQVCGSKWLLPIINYWCFYVHLDTLTEFYHHMVVCQLWLPATHLGTTQCSFSVLLGGTKTIMTYSHWTHELWASYHK